MKYRNYVKHMMNADEAAVYDSTSTEDVLHTAIESMPLKKDVCDDCVRQYSCMGKVLPSIRVTPCPWHMTEAEYKEDK